MTKRLRKEEKPILLEVPEWFRIIRYDDRNLHLEIWQPEKIKTKMTYSEGYRFKGYFQNLKQIFSKLLTEYITSDENAMEDLKKTFERIEEAERKIVKLFEDEVKK